uniref:Uncharacterized protein n=1 Tax=Zea mays TaxID=4577 RepID=C0PA93_MAIZE|nr:unknown [Zea mays]
MCPSVLKKSVDETTPWNLNQRTSNSLQVVCSVMIWVEMNGVVVRGFQASYVSSSTGISA